MDATLQAIKERHADLLAAPGPLSVDDYAHAADDIAYLLSLLELVQRAEKVQHKVNWD